MKWKHEIDISLEYFQYEQDQDFSKYKKAVIEKIQASDSYKELKDEFEVFIQQLNDVVDDLDEWDLAFEDLYDFCDEHKIWVRVQ